MRVVAADVEERRLHNEVAKLREEGAPVVGVVADVSEPKQVDGIADETLVHFGRVDLVCNNAGVSAGGALWEVDSPTWAWVLSVNLGGVVNGIRTFVPILREQGVGHIVNTGSFAGLVTGPNIGVYSASKHAVVAVSECLYKDLRADESPVGVSVVCPAYVHTQLLTAERNRPGGPRVTAKPANVSAAIRATSTLGLQPADVAAAVVDAVQQGRFWVLTHPDRSWAITRRAEQIVAGEDPDAGYPT
jgi:NAD(P)-dependent dehydrogenase (short-subunit alcohol dehydrogenase family)